MRNIAKVVVKAEGINARIFVDGVKVNGVKAFYLEHTVNQVPVVHLDIVANEYENDLEDVFVKMAPPETERADVNS